MVSLVNTDNLSLQFKVYLLVLHTVFLGLIVHVLSAFVFTKPRTKGESSDQKSEKHCSGVRTVHVDGKRVTVESCHWINSILNWLYMNASSTPDLVKIWLTMLNEKLKAEKNELNYKINGIVPGSLPPTFTNVYCSSVHGNTQCVALHIETTRLGFYISLSDNNNQTLSNSSNVQVNITKLSGELIFQILVRESHYDLTVKFIGNPELKVSCDDITEDSQRAAIEEKLKEVICKTVVNIPLTDGKPSDESITSCLSPQTSTSCVDLDGKLLVKVIKASGITGKDEKDTPDAYCVVTCKDPRQKKRTAAITGSKEPFWNESFVLDISKNTKEVSFDLYDAIKTPKNKDFHMNDYSDKSSDTDLDFLGQVIVPLPMIGKEQSCRLILPILPISAKSSHVTGQMNLEFTYDAEGKVFETYLQSDSSPSKGAAEATTIPDKAEDNEETNQSPQKVVFSMATLDIYEDEDDQLHFEPLADHGINREDIVMAEQRISEGRLTNREVIAQDDEVTAEEKRKHEEMFEELLELDRRSTPQGGLTDDENSQPIPDLKEVDGRPPSNTEPTKPTLHTSSPPQVTVTSPSEDMSPSPTKSLGHVEDVPDLQIDESSIEDLTPNTRRKVFRKAFSMRINRNHQSPDEGGTKNPDERRSSGSELRQSFHSGDEVSPKAKSGSQESLSSVYEGTKSILVVETKDRGEIKYCQIPPLMAKRGTFDHKGTKLHIFNSHLFVATHFTGSLPSCDVCKLPLTGYFGKQGYQCRDCQMVTHKKCHLEVSTGCANSTLPSLKIIVLHDKLE